MNMTVIFHCGMFESHCCLWSSGEDSAKDNAREDPNDGSGSEATKWHFPCFSLNSTAPLMKKRITQQHRIISTSCVNALLIYEKQFPQQHS